MVSTRAKSAIGVAVVAAWLLTASVSLYAGDIHDAVRKNDFQTVRTLITENPDLVHARDSNGRTPLHAAAQYAVPEIVSYLVGSGADVNARSSRGGTPLRYTEDAEIAEILIEHGAKLTTDSNGDTELDHAVQGQNLLLVDVLVKAGGKLAFEQLAELGRTEEVSAALKEQRLTAQALAAALHAAAFNGHLETVRVLLEHGADPNLNDVGDDAVPRFTAFSVAVLYDHYEVARLLCRHGALVKLAGGWFGENLFPIAVGIRDIRMVRLMLELGADVNTVYGGSGSDSAALHVAAVIGDVEKCRLLIEHNADVNIQTRDGATPLTFAAFLGHQDISELLITAGAEMDVYTACALGKLTEVRSMLKARPTLVNTPDQRIGRTPLFWATEHGHTDVVKFLIDQGARVGMRAPPYYSSLGGGKSGEVVGPRVDNGAKVGDPKVGETPLHVAASKGHTDIARLLLDKKVKVDAEDQDGESPLCQAVDGQHIETVELLLERDANVNLAMRCFAWDGGDREIEIAHLLLSKRPKKKSLDRALRSAAGRNRGVADLLLKHGAEADLYTACVLGLKDRVGELLKAKPNLLNTPKSSYPGDPPITLGAGHGHRETVAFLHDQGADLYPTKGGYPLNAAAEHGHLDVVKLLVARGADVNRKAGWAMTPPLHDAAYGGHADVIRFLLEQNAELMAIDSQRNTALHWAAWSGHVEAAKVLLEAGIPVDVRSDFRSTPLHDAAYHGHTETAALLIGSGADVNARNRRGETSLFRVEEPLWRRYTPPGEEPPDLKPVADLLRRHGGVR